MQTDNTHVLFTAHDVDVVRHHTGRDLSASRTMIRKLVKLGVVTKVDSLKIQTYQATVDDFMFYFILRYSPMMKAVYWQQLFGTPYPFTINR